MLMFRVLLFLAACGPSDYERTLERQRQNHEHAAAAAKEGPLPSPPRSQEDESRWTCRVAGFTQSPALMYKCRAQYAREHGLPPPVLTHCQRGRDGVDCVTF